MKPYRGGRPQGRQAKEWNEYVPKGKDPVQLSEDNDYYYEPREDFDRKRPTEDKFDQKKSNKYDKGSDRWRADDKDSYVKKDYPRDQADVYP